MKIVPFFKCPTQIFCCCFFWE